MTLAYLYTHTQYDIVGYNLLTHRILWLKKWFPLLPKTLSSKNFSTNFFVCFSTRSPTHFSLSFPSYRSFDFSYLKILGRFLRFVEWDSTRKLNIIMYTYFVSFVSALISLSLLFLLYILANNNKYFLHIHFKYMYAEILCYNSYFIIIQLQQQQQKQEKKTKNTKNHISRSNNDTNTFSKSEDEVWRKRWNITREHYKWLNMQSIIEFIS